jgi:signal transduction histidine kinase
VVAEFGLAAALQDTCHSLNTPSLRWQCLVFLDEDHPLALPLQVAVYRLAQELTQNVAKHAQASQATLEVETLPGWVVLHLEDDGRGFFPGPPTPRRGGQNQPLPPASGSKPCATAWPYLGAPST